MISSSYNIVTVILVAASLLWYTASGQMTLTLVENPVNEFDNVMGTCSVNPPGAVGVNVVVNSIVGGGGVMSEVIQLGGQTNFVLPNVTREANGSLFTCAQVGSDTVFFGNETLIVNFAPNYTDVLSDQEISKDGVLGLTFNLDAQPSMGDNFTYTWTKNGIPFTSSSNIAVTATSISITSAECSDNGIYNVTATNPLGSDSVSFRLSVLCPPTFEAGSGIIPISVIAGQNYSINCRVNESYPLNPTITLIRPDNTMSDVTANPIRYFSQNQADTYMYMCRANNTRATNTLTYRVSVTMSPITPTPTPVLPTVIPTPIGPTSDFASLGLIIGVVVGVTVLACVISTLVPLLICCCLGVACFASIGCLAKNKKKEVELAKL